MVLYYKTFCLSGSYKPLCKFCGVKIFILVQSLFALYRVKWILQVVLLLLPVLHLRTRNHWEGKLIAPVFPWLPLWGKKKMESSSLAFHLGSQVINFLSTGHNFQGNSCKVHHKLARFFFTFLNVASSDKHGVTYMQLWPFPYCFYHHHQLLISET